MQVDKIVFSTFLPREKVCYDELTPLYFPPAKKEGDKQEEAEEEKEDKETLQRAHSDISALSGSQGEDEE